MYKYKKRLNADFDTACVNIRKELDKEKFGVLTFADIKVALKKTIDVDYTNYVIFGMCSGKDMYSMLKIDKDIGLGLPCNIAIYDLEGEVFISAIKPSESLSFVKSDEVKSIVEDIDRRLVRVIDAMD